MTHVILQNDISVEYGSLHDEERTEPASEGNKDLIKGCSPCLPHRYRVAVMAFFGFFLAMSTRISFNIALVAMVNDTSEEDVNMTSQECPVSPSFLNSSTKHTGEGEFPWQDVQSLLLGGFFYGYVFTQLPGGYLAERFGAKLVFGCSVLLPGLLTLAAPSLARWDYRALLACRICMGITQGPLYPSNQAIWAKWAPPLESSRLLSIAMSGSSVGSLVSVLVTGLLCDTSFLGGWPSPFYILGSACVLWFIVWYLLMYNTPSQHPYISTQELLYIEGATGSLDKQPYVSPPWRAMLTSRAVYALFAYQLADGLGFYVLFSSVPIYMKQILRFDMSQEGELDALPYLVNFLVIIAVGPIADCLRTRYSLSTTCVRKLFTFIGEVGMAVSLLGLGYVDCNQVMAVSLLVVGMGISGCTVAGASINTVDIAPRYAGTLHGMANILANLGGFISPQIVHAITGGQPSSARWQIVFYVTAAFYLAGTLSFLILGSGEVQPWAVAPRGGERAAPDTADPDHVHEERRPLIN